MSTMRSHVVACLCMLALAGCATAHDAFTNPTGVITVPRQDFIDTYARARELYRVIYAHAQHACQTNVFTAAKCAQVAELHEQAKAIDFEVRAKLAVPETELDWAMIEKVLGFAVKLVL